MYNYVQLVIAILLPVVGGWSTSQVMVGQVRRPGGKAWYQTIRYSHKNYGGKTAWGKLAFINTVYSKTRKPSWTPRNSLFAPVWVVLYTSMGAASYVVYREEDLDKVKLPLILYGIQLLLNFSWTPIFFGLHWLRMAFLEMLVLDVAAVVCTYSFYQTSSTAALLMCPYLVWLAFASYLNYTVWTMNQPPRLSRKNEN